MKKILIAAVLTIAAICLPPPQQARAEPITVIITTVVKKVLKAMDLAIQRLQDETIRLQNIQRVAENLMNKLKLEEIFQWSEKQKELFGQFYDELWKIKTALTYYQRVRDIVQMQVRLVKEYHIAVGNLHRHGGFKPEEIDQMLRVYSGILQESVDNVSHLTEVITSLRLQMSDAKRLAMIQDAGDRIQTNFNALRSFNREAAMLALSRAKDQSEITTLKNLFGLP